MENRKRTWTFVLYPESCPSDFLNQFSEMGLVGCCCLHDKDTEATGEIKKAHYHVVLNFTGKKSYEQVLEITQKFKGTIPQAVNNTTGIVRYMCHLDNPDKTQYPRSSVKSFGGFDTEKYFSLSLSEKRNELKNIMSFILKNDIYEYCDFIQYCLETENDEWFDIATNTNTLAIRSIISSRRHKITPK